MIQLIGLFVCLIGLESPAHSLDDNEAQLLRGQELYQSNCFMCHGTSGRGDGPAARAVSGSPPRNFVQEDFKYGSSPEDIFQTITKGVTGTVMPSWKHLSEEDRKALSHYVLNFRKGQDRSAASSPQGSAGK